MLLSVQSKIQQSLQSRKNQTPNNITNHVIITTVILILIHDFINNKTTAIIIQLLKIIQIQSIQTKQ